MTFTVKIWRAGSSQDPNGNGGPGIAVVNSTVGTTLPASTDANVITDVTKALNDTYTPANVSVSSDPYEYKWRWNEELEIWELVCVAATAFLVEIGEPRKIHVEVAITVIV